MAEMMRVPKHDVLARASKGPFLCGICEYFDPPKTCTHEYIVEHYGPTVAFYDCCDFFERTKSTIFLTKKS